MVLLAKVATEDEVAGGTLMTDAIVDKVIGDDEKQLDVAEEDDDDNEDTYDVGKKGNVVNETYGEDEEAGAEGEGQDVQEEVTEKAIGEKGKDGEDVKERGGKENEKEDLVEKNAGTEQMVGENAGTEDMEGENEGGKGDGDGGDTPQKGVTTKKPSKSYSDLVKPHLLQIH